MSPVQKTQNANPIKVVRPTVETKAAAPKAAPEAPVAKPAVEPDALVRTSGPRAPKPTNVRLTALEQMEAERPKFGTPEEYKNYVIKFAGYIKAAKNDLEIAQRSLDAEKEKEGNASAEFIKPLN